MKKGLIDGDPQPLHYDYWATRHCPQCQRALSFDFEHCPWCGSILEPVEANGYGVPVHKVTGIDIARYFGQQFELTLGKGTVDSVAIERWVDDSPASTLTAVPARSTPPPKWATFLLHVLLPHRNRRAVVGDLVEEYADLYATYGRGAATWWFVWQVSRSVARLTVLAWVMRQLHQLVS